MSLQPLYTETRTGNNNSAEFYSPTFQNRVNWMGWSSAVLSAAGGAYAGYMFKPNIQYTHGDTIERVTPLGKAVLGGLAGGALSLSLTFLIGGGTPPVNEGNADLWLERLDDELVRIKKGSPYQKRAVGNIVGISRAAERTFSVGSEADARIFSEAFPTSIYTDSILDVSKDKIERKELPGIIEVFSDSRAIPELQAAYCRRSSSVNECIEAATRYPAHIDIAQRRAAQVIESVREAEQFVEAFPVADREGLQRRVSELVASLDDARVYVARFRHPDLDDSVVRRLVPLVKRTDIPALVLLFQNQPSVDEARKRYITTADDFQSVVEAHERFPEMRVIAADRAAAMAAGARHLRKYLEIFPGAPGDADVRRRLERIDADNDEALLRLEQKTNTLYNLLVRAKRGDRKAYAAMERVDETEVGRIRARVDELKGGFSDFQMARLAQIEAKGAEGQQIVQELQNAERTTVTRQTTATTGGTTSNRQFDRFLNEYEKFVNEYIAVMRRVSRGDMTAIQKYPALYQKAVNAQQQLEGVRGNLSTAQMNRYIRLQTKLANGAAQ